MLCHHVVTLQHGSYVYFISTAEYADNSLQAGIQSHKLMPQIKSKIKSTERIQSTALKELNPPLTLFTCS